MPYIYPHPTHPRGPASYSLSSLPPPRSLRSTAAGSTSLPPVNRRRPSVSPPPASGGSSRTEPPCCRPSTASSPDALLPPLHSIRCEGRRLRPRREEHRRPRWSDSAQGRWRLAHVQGRPAPLLPPPATSTARPRGRSSSACEAGRGCGWSSDGPSRSSGWPPHRQPGLCVVPSSAPRG
jgi:hypothetical protein